MKLIIGIMALIALLPLTVARADVTFEMKHNDASQTIRVAPDKIDIVTGATQTIFRGDKEVLWVCDPEQKTYYEITKEQAQKLGEQAASAMSQMQETLKNLPPEQRAAVEKMMASKMKPAAESKRVIKPLDQKKTINGFDCSGYQVLTDAGTTEIWAADLKTLKLDSKDLSAFKELAEFVKGMTRGMEQMTDLAKDFEHPQEGQVPGFPVLTIFTDKDSKEVWRTELVKVDQSAIAASAFELPEGFTKSEGMGHPRKPRPAK
jgi:hypothetical protein